MTVAMDRWASTRLFFGIVVGSTASRVRGSGTHVEQSVYGTERTATFQTK